jgi:NADPH-dependent 7-cyano-7-deazaguanine reductase QueF
MWPIILQWVIKQILTPQNIRYARQAIIAWLLKEVPNTENKIDDQVVKIVADALNVCPKTGIPKDE